MAFPTIPTAAGGDLLVTPTSTASTTHTFPTQSSLRGGAGPLSGDLLIAICVQYQGGTSGNEFTAWGGSFTERADLATVTALDMAIGVATKVAAGGETGTFTATSGHSFMSHNFLIRIPAAEWHGTTVPEISTAVRATGAVADPPSLDPTNWGAEDTLWIAVYGHSETTTTGSPPDITASPTNYSGDLISGRGADAVGNLAAGVGFRQVNATAEDAGTWTVANATRGNGIAATIAVRPNTAAPINKTLGIATNVNTSQTLSVTKTILKSIGTATGVNTAQPRTAGRFRTLGVATTANAAQPVTSHPARSVGIPTQPNAAQPLSITKTIRKTITQAMMANWAVLPDQARITPPNQPNTAQILVIVKRKTLGLATSPNAAQPRLPTKVIYKNIGVVTTQDQCQNIGPKRLLGRVTVTMYAMPLSYEKNYTRLAVAVL